MNFKGKWRARVELSIFTKGVKLFLSLGGPNPDKDTLKVWFGLLSDIHPQDYGNAVVDICKTNKDLGRINFVAEVLERVKLHKGERRRAETRAERQLPPKDMVRPEKLRALIKDFNNSLKGVE